MGDLQVISENSSKSHASSFESASSNIAVVDVMDEEDGKQVELLSKEPNHSFSNSGCKGSIYSFDLPKYNQLV